ncbi:hypothetical protein DUNSADRAFT_15360 [Dunaliella salina]|uniref:Citrate transporter-like domain-containing protein n=1 Tax=Dunaliella salina TaxID=3046 RepID=A0ABQ7H1T1_DUNSA|nr:hypothetical protein DUNSADRAFT_15360 [Dunaliella salina]|eukprot:KAF5840818.1 hypothetical protein DUNSADRAFT_15360 [Dunaliella salina]
MCRTVYITVASAFGVSLATEKTNVSQNIGKIFISISSGIGGKAALLSCLYIATGALSEILTNNASAALMYPIAAAAGDKLGVKPQLISVSIMLGANSAFMSPFGFQTNLMVYGAGNYKTLDFVKYGAGLKIWLWIVASVMLGLDQHKELLLGLSVGGAAASVLLPLLSVAISKEFANKVTKWGKSLCTRQKHCEHVPELEAEPEKLVQ